MSDDDRFTFTASDGSTIAARHWPADGETRRVLIVAHGMGEHGARYREPLAPLSRAGVTVYAPDHRGHGATAPDGTHGDFGPGGFAALVDDLAVLARRAAAEHPGVPMVLLGHSMGSFAAQAFATRHGDLIDGLALSGSAALEALLPRMAEGGGLEAFNAAFEPARTPFDWLSRDEGAVDRYLADRWCGFSVDAAGQMSMAAMAPQMADVAALPAGLPVYILSGLDDPLAAAIEPLIARYRAAGAAVTTDLYPGGRHEMLNETNRDEVVANLARWLETVPRRAR
ncbi:alpha/beta hydrolase [Sphingomonas corticis]|jgi:alpha-beta hydrolase superfamily lysophospholipase|uniref:Alpha/beta hydrolase n=1 Tax=Sphingomonas corticis TaxID=2722791 RepID=A0ABX1CMQ9_9SPHN|nr:alpha/beta hydrolase [Sphingomonas corticis]NJR79228.1 alpha/beta hydrolase [Sphingomonas corticis]